MCCGHALCILALHQPDWCYSYVELVTSKGFWCLEKRAYLLQDCVGCMIIEMICSTMGLFIKHVLNVKCSTGHFIAY